MNSFRDYKNFSSRARFAAWLIDLFLGIPFRFAAALRRTALAFSTGKRAAPPTAPQRILLIRLDHIGDLLMTTPAIRALKARFPEASLHFLASPASRPVVESNPDIEKTYVFRVPWYDGGRAQRFRLGEYVRLIRGLRRERFDAAIDFRGDIRVMFLFLLLSGSRQCVGFSGLGGEFLLTRSVPFSQEHHFAELNLDLARCLGGEAAQAAPRDALPATAREAQSVSRLLAEEGIAQGELLIAIHSTTIPHWRLKRWPPQCFAAVADSLAEETGARILLTGGSEDRQEVERLTGLMKKSSVNLAGRTSIPQLAELFRSCRLVITNDTGPMHVAAAVGAPLVAIFGPTAPGRSGPLGDPDRVRIIRRDVPCRRPCFVTSCPRGHECMEGIGLEEVLAACQELLRGRPAAAGGRP